MKCMVHVLSMSRRISDTKEIKISEIDCEFNDKSFANNV